LLGNLITDIYLMNIEWVLRTLLSSLCRFRVVPERKREKQNRFNTKV